MDSTNAQEHKIPFRGGKDAATFQQEVILRLIKEFDRRRTKFIPPENIMVFQHGRAWNFQRLGKTGFEQHSGEMELKSSLVEMKLERIVAHDCDLLSDFIREMADKMEQQSTTGLLKEMSEVAQESGNTFVIPRSGLTPELFLQLVQSSHASVGKDGTVAKPSFFNLPEEALTNLIREAERLGPQFTAKLEAAWQEKEREAREREAVRIAKFA